MNKNKLGLYARYEKITGSFINTDIMHRSDAFKSNQDNKHFFLDLLTDDPERIHNYPEDEIPKISPSFDENMCKESHSNYFQCEECCEYFTKDEMYHIPTQEERDEGICAICINCE